MGGLRILFLNPPFGEHVLLLRFQKREFPDFLKIAVETAFRRRCREISIVAHGPVLRFRTLMFKGLTWQIRTRQIAFKINTSDFLTHHEARSAAGASTFRQCHALVSVR